MGFTKYLLDSKMFEYDKHFRECQQLNKPFIKAKTNPKHGNYFVQIDLMTCNYNFTQSEIQTMKKMIEVESNSFQDNTKYSVPEFNIDKELAWFDGITSSRIDDFCSYLYDLTQKNH